jgi:hypothetical protein
MAAANIIEDRSRAWSRRSRQLYIVEHTLLRFALLDRVAEDFIYDFTITAVIAMDNGTLSNLDQTLVRDVIRANTPAHLVVDYCFLTTPQMIEFESLYWAWRRALRERQRQPLIVASTRLRDFLNQ